MTTPDRREFFGRTRAGLAAAKRRFAELSLAPPMAIEERESDEEVAERIHLTDDMVERFPELLDENRRVTRSPNPEYGKNLPRRQRIDAQVDALFAAGFTPRPAKSRRGRSPQPDEGVDGQAIPVAKVGELYRKWYAAEKWDVPALQALADAHNVAAREHNANVRKRIEEKKAAGAKVSKWTKSLRRMKLTKFIDFVARRSEKQHYREHKSYFREFVKFLDTEFHGDVTVDELTAEHFRKYRDHVRARVRRLKKVTNKDIWMNRRFGAVTTAFRRVKKDYDLAWSQGIFGEDGHLAILEQRNKVQEAEAVKLTPAEFRALLHVADIQWKAILLLALNCALANVDVCDIHWSHLSLEKKLMVFRRHKTKRRRSGKRQTPLWPETIAALLAWKAARPGAREEVFVTWQGDAWTPNGVYDHFNALKARVKEETEAEIPGTFRSLRKTAATAAYAATGHDEARDMLLGQANERSWRHYALEAPPHLRVALEAIHAEYALSD